MLYAAIRDAPLSGVSSYEEVVLLLCFTSGGIRYVLVAPIADTITFCCCWVVQTCTVRCNPCFTLFVSPSTLTLPFLLGQFLVSLPSAHLICRLSLLARQSGDDQTVWTMLTPLIVGLTRSIPLRVFLFYQKNSHRKKLISKSCLSPGT